ncbi:MFS transporter [Sphingomonas sp.]|uniref:MFS transporter n=1 Tax=Sphingomonas sp. TaxID=28214 RepID=UPI002DD631AA|nr:MFS transporter [Sphingomonas sp.]
MTDGSIAAAQVTPARRRVSVLVTAICWFALFAEGYDLGVLGAVMPAFLADPQWHLDPATAGMIASAALVGMFFGAYLFGTFGDRFGRKPCFLACLTIFSVAAGLSALAPTPTVFAVLRFITGIGIGGIVPVAAALTSEYAPPGKANRQFALMYTGYSLGIFTAALSALMLVEDYGWRPVVGIGALPLIFVPVIAWVLPESVVFLRSKGRHAAADAVERRLGVTITEDDSQPSAGDAAGVRALFADGRARATLGFWFATFAGMILVYGLNTWLPQIMRSAGYELGPSIMFLGVFALSSSIGGIVLGAIADRVGRVPTIFTAFCIGAVAILSLWHIWPLPLTYLIVAIAGLGSTAAAVMVTSYLSSYFPATLRATAVGCCVSFSRFGAVCGPLLGGFIAQYGLAIGWNFVAFALAALAAAGSILLVPARPVAR